jgi:peptide deformylase
VTSPLSLRYYGDPVLREKAKPVTTFEASVRELAEAMFECMYREAGLGLAAPQVGSSLRLFVIDVEAGEGARVKRAFVNPVIAAKRGSDVGEEGCLSIPGLRADVKRAAHVEVEAMDENGAPFRLEAEGLVARAIQHEIDHLDGILFIDRLSPIHRKLIEGKLKRIRPAVSAAEASGTPPSL